MIDDGDCAFGQESDRLWWGSCFFCVARKWNQQWGESSFTAYTRTGWGSQLTNVWAALKQVPLQPTGVFKI